MLYIYFNNKIVNTTVYKLQLFYYSHVWSCWLVVRRNLTAFCVLDDGVEHGDRRFDLLGRSCEEGWRKYLFWKLLPESSADSSEESHWWMNDASWSWLAPKRDLSRWILPCSEFKVSFTFSGSLLFLHNLRSLFANASICFRQLLILWP